MIATLNSDCSIITLKSDYLSTAVDKTFDSIVLKSRINCSLTESTVDVSSLIHTIDNNEISIPATYLFDNGAETVYCDGVYYFQLEITYTFHGDVYMAMESVCKLVDCSLKCKVLTYYTSTKNKDAWYYYYALVQGGSCDSCYCTEMCSLYQELKLLINDSTNTNTTTGCGCA